MLLYVPHDRVPRRSPMRLRAAVWSRRGRLDAALAAGERPESDPLLAFRAEQLTSSAGRLELARAIRNLIDSAEEPPDAWRFGGSRPPLQRDAILDARDDLAALADRLDEPRAVEAGGAAQAAALVWDSASPLYAPDPDGRLSETVWEVRRALDAL